MKQHISTTGYAAALLAATALMGTAFASGALAASGSAPPAAGDTTATAPAGQASGVGVRMSQNATAAMEEVAIARIALMENSLQQATSFLQQAKTQLSDAKDGYDTAQLQDFSRRGPASGALSDTRYYPVSVTPASAGSAGDRAADGTGSLSDQASDGSGKPAGSAASVATVALLPRDATMTAIKTAIGQIGDGKLSAADMTLAGVDKAVVYGKMTPPKSS